MIYNRIMNIANAAQHKDFFMPPDELEDFRRYLSIAIEDLINVRPDNAKKYLALALCRAIPAEDSLRFDFPELEKDLTFEETQKLDPSEDPISN